MVRKDTTRSIAIILEFQLDLSSEMTRITVIETFRGLIGLKFGTQLMMWPVPRARPITIVKAVTGERRQHRFKGLVTRSKGRYSTFRSAEGDRAIWVHAKTCRCMHGYVGTCRQPWEHARISWCMHKSSFQHVFGRKRSPTRHFQSDWADFWICRRSIDFLTILKISAFYLFYFRNFHF